MEAIAGGSIYLLRWSGLQWQYEIDAPLWIELNDCRPACLHLVWRKRFPFPR